MSKFKLLAVLGEILDEVTSWYTMKQIVVLFLVIGALVAIIIPVLVKG